MDMCIAVQLHVMRLAAVDVRLADLIFLMLEQGWAVLIFLSLLLTLKPRPQHSCV